MGARYGYILSSSNQEKESANNALKLLAVPPENIYQDNPDGKKQQTEYQKLLNKLERGDLLYIKSLSWLGETYKDIRNQWWKLINDKRIDVIVLDMPLVDTRRGRDVVGSLVSDLITEMLSFTSEKEEVSGPEFTSQFSVKMQSKASHLMDLTGKRYGRLTALYPMQQRDKKGSVYWHCRCECGNEVDVTSSNLEWGCTNSCGCLKAEYQQAIGTHLTLVDGTGVEWLEKRKHRADNTSGYQGVTRTMKGTYKAYIGFKRKRYHIGTYKTIDEAVAAREEAEELVHGGFVRAYREWQTKALADPEWGDNNPLHYDVEKVNGKLTVVCG